MKELIKTESLVISGGSEWPIGQCYAPGNELKTLADHYEDGRDIGSRVRRVLGYLGSALDSAWDRAKW